MADENSQHWCGNDLNSLPKSSFNNAKKTNPTGQKKKKRFFMQMIYSKRYK